MINTIIVVLLVCLILLVIFLIIKIKEYILNLKMDIYKDNSELKNYFSNDIRDNLSSLKEKMARIDVAQQNIDKLSANISEFQKVLTDKKTRGIYGEVQLYTILNSIFGEKGKIYDTQYKLDGGIVDAIVFCPDHIGNIPIDSKFPLENYQKGNTNEFIRDVKKHIDDIKGKYTGYSGINQAIMFIPAESIFEAVISTDNLVEYSHKNKVWICSPTTLMATLTTLQVTIIEHKRSENVKIITNQLLELEVEFNRFDTRWKKLAKDIDTIVKDVKDINTTTDKIVNKFEKINKSN